MFVLLISYSRTTLHSEMALVVLAIGRNCSGKLELCVRPLSTLCYDVVHCVLLCCAIDSATVQCQVILCNGGVDTDFTTVPPPATEPCQWYKKWKMAESDVGCWINPPTPFHLLPAIKYVFSILLLDN